MGSSSGGNGLVLQGYRYEECQISSFSAADFGACLNIGDHRMSDLALAILNCRLKVDERDPSECVLSIDKQAIKCPTLRSEVLSHEILDILLELYDACHPHSLNFFKDQTTLLSLELTHITKETITHHSAIRDDFKKVLQQTKQLNFLLKDNLAVGNELLKHTDSVKTLRSTINKLSQEIKQIPIEDKTNVYRSAKEALGLELNSIQNVETLVEALSQDSMKSSNIFTFENRSFVDHAEGFYCSFCRCLFVYLFSRALGFVILAFVMLPILVALQAALVSKDKPFFIGADMVLNQIILVLFFILRGTGSMEKKWIRTTSQSSCN